MADFNFGLHVHNVVAVFGIWSIIICCLCFSPAAGAELTAADYFVRSLPGAPKGPLLKMHAGHIEVDSEHNGHLFFWHYQNRHIANKQRTVLWLNGGPGCSSEDGALMEIGPYRLKNDHTLEYNEGSWDEFANVLFVDQPVGTGFSFVDTNAFVKDLDQMAASMIVFLEKFFSLFPEYEKDDLYLAGESYAGQYIPYIAKAILNRNKQKNPWNLAGLLIGNGWISPVEQYMAYSSFAYKEGMIQQGSDSSQTIDLLQTQCIQALDKVGTEMPVDVPKCERILTETLSLTRKDNKCYNMYDIRLRDTYPSCGMNWPPDLQHVTPYLRRADVIEALHINPDKRSGWTECSGAVSSNFNPTSRASITLLPDLLRQVPILLFSGDRDFICNHLGTEELIHNMRWNGGKGFEISPGVWAPRRDWVFEGDPAGIYQQARNLTYVLFYNASHMVPFDWPRRSRDMLDRFMGVDITAVGGKPADSRIDGEKGPLTSVGSHPNSTIAEEAEKQRLEQATWNAYYRSGEVVLVIVVAIACVYGWLVWREHRHRKGYQGLFTPFGTTYQDRNGSVANVGLSRFRNKSTEPDIEAADFDENMLDDLQINPARGNRHGDASAHAELEHDLDEDRYSLGGTSSDEDDRQPK